MSSGLMLCDECDKRTTCRTLCPHAEEYVNQDSVSRQEQILDDFDNALAVNDIDYKGILHTRMRNIERGAKLTPKMISILEMYIFQKMYKKKVNIKQIASNFNCNASYIYQVVSYYKKENL